MLILKLTSAQQRVSSASCTLAINIVCEVVQQTLVGDERATPVRGSRPTASLTRTLLHARTNIYTRLQSNTRLQVVPKSKTLRNNQEIVFFKHANEDSFWSK